MTALIPGQRRAIVSARTHNCLRPCKASSPASLTSVSDAPPLRFLERQWQLEKALTHMSESHGTWQNAASVLLDQTWNLADSHKPTRAHVLDIE
jgi:hypothetical protein